MIHGISQGYDAFKILKYCGNKVKAYGNEYGGTFREVVAYNKRTRKKSLECARKTAIT